MELKEQSSYQLHDSDIETFTTRDSGPGGQHRNTTDSCVVMRHKPTGIEAKAAAKSQHQNRKVARELLEARVSDFFYQKHRTRQDSERQQKRGSGQRGDKVKTYRVKDNSVVDHRSNKKLNFKKLLKGDLQSK